MADKTSSELDDLAFRIYSERVAAGRGGEAVAIDSYRKATDFVTVRDKMRTGQLSAAKPEGVQLAECCAPNLDRNHPLNLVAKVFTDRKGASFPGDISKVRRINKWLSENPTPESDPEELVPRLSQSFPELGWNLPTINTARAVFPNYSVSN